MALFQKFGEIGAHFLHILHYVSAPADRNGNKRWFESDAHWVGKGKLPFLMLTLNITGWGKKKKKKEKKKVKKMIFCYSLTTLLSLFSPGSICA